MLWFNFILGSIFIFRCFCVWYCVIISIKERKIKIEPRIKLNHNILYTLSYFSLLAACVAKYFGGHRCIFIIYFYILII